MGEGEVESCALGKVNEGSEAADPSWKEKGETLGRVELGSRHYQCLMLFFMLFLAYSMRFNLSVAIVAMTSPIGSYTDNEQGIILGAFFWGYLWLQMLSGQLSRRYGAKYFLLASTLGCSIVTILSPLIASNCSWIVFCVSRVLVGLFQSSLYSCTATHLARWAPPLEKGRMFTFVFMGTQFGSMVTVSVSGYLATSSLGWPSVFYVTGLAGVLWSVIWLLFGADSPDTHPRISPKEKLFIKAALVGASDDCSKLKTPWKKIVTSIPLWSTLIAHSCQNWGYWMLASLLPSYFSYVLKFDLKNNGLLTALPYLLQCIVMVLVSWVDDFVKRRRLLSLSCTRKIANSIAHWVGAAALVAISLTLSTPLAVALLTLALTVNGCVYSGSLCNTLDLSPNFAGLLMGITNGFSTLTAILGPTVTGFIVEDKTSRGQWMIAFDVAAALFFLGNLLFVIFGSGEVQPWNEPKGEVDSRGEENGTSLKENPHRCAQVNEGFENI